jgi:hypothetical protein
MSRCSIFVFFFICSFCAKAQTNNLPVVSLDKMNVLFYGVDNPITIGTPVDIDKVKISIINGTIVKGIDTSKISYNRIVRPSAIGKNTKIIIEINGVKETFEYRVKRMPDPIFKLGSGRTRMVSAEFKNQQFCRAELENFDFDLKYNVISAEVYFSGANFPNLMVGHFQGNDLSTLNSYFQKCGPGSTITFDNIKVQGPDGIRTIDSKSYTLF